MTIRPTIDPTDIAPGLLEMLRKAGDEYGPLGVALVAATLTDRDALFERLLAEERERWQPVIEFVRTIRDECQPNNQPCLRDLDRLIELIDRAAEPITEDPPELGRPLTAAQRAAVKALLARSKPILVAPPRSPEEAITKEDEHG